MVASKCIAYAKSCQIHISTQTEDSSTKDDANDWSKIDVVGKSWDVQTESLVTLSDNGSNGELPLDLLNLILNSTQVTLTFDQTSGTNNRTAQSSAIAMSGSAYLTDFNISAANRQSASVSCQFTGDGALALS